MSCLNNDIDQSMFVTRKLGENIPEDHECRFIKKFVEENFSYLDDENKKKRNGRPSFKKMNLLSLLCFASFDGIESLKKVSEYCKFHDCYKFMMDGLQPSERTLQRFVHDFGYLFKDVNDELVRFASDNELTDFNHVAIDGTIIKANNSNYNIIKMKDIEKLLKLLPETLDEEELKEAKKSLNRSAYKILTSIRMTNEEKIDYVKFLKSELEKSGQTSIGLNDYDARWMINKKGLPEIAYNLQSAVDYDSKLVVSFDLVQDPTDHHQLAKQVDNIKESIQETPQKISADTIYNTKEGLNKLEQEEIDGYIPTRKQSKQYTDRLNPNPYHKDHFEYDFKTDSYICPQNVELPHQKTYIEKSKTPGKPDKIRKVYYTSTCNNCLFKEECTKSPVRVYNRRRKLTTKANGRKNEDRRSTRRIPETNGSRSTLRRTQTTRRHR